MHSLLKRQLKRHFGDSASMPEEWRGFVQSVNEAYKEFDADRGMLERSLELSSQELLHANSEMRAIFKAIPDLMFRVDCEGTILEYAAAGTSDLFRNPKELLGKRIQDVPAREAAEKFSAALERVRVTKSTAVIEYCLPFDERNNYYEARLVPLPQDQIIAIVRNITDRKRAEMELLREKQFAEKLLESLPGIFFLYDSTCHLKRWNKAHETATGFTADELRDWYIPNWHETPEDAVVGMTLVKSVLETGVGRAFETTLINKEGHFIPYLITVTRLMTSDGPAMMGVGIDITERKRAEAALRESQRQLGDIINFLPDATLVIDKDGKVIAWNRAIEAMTGVKAEEMVGKGNHEYSIPFYGERRPILIDLVFKPQEEVKARYNYVEKKETVIAGEAYTPVLRGGEAYLLETASALFDLKGNMAGAIESIRDITERRRVEEALIQAEEKYRSIFENAIEGIFQTTFDGSFISVNPAFTHVLGYDSPEEVLNTITDIYDQIYVNPDHRAQLLSLLIEQGKVSKFETQFYRKDGSIAWVALNIHAAHDKTGQISYLEGTAEDISGRKTLEARLLQVQKMEAIGTLAGGIAHDFNNILAPIIGYSELALQKIPVDTQLYNNIERVLRSAFRAKDLVKQILTFSRKTEQERRPVQISSIVEETHQMLRATLPSTIEINRKIDQAAINSTVMADPTQIHQMLMNLCTNAAHAMRENGGVLSISLAKVNIDSALGTEIPGMEDGSYLRLSVSDTGHGMSEEVRQRIFDPYFTTKGPDEGTGLGLAVVYGIVKDLSGGITVSSKPGEGTTFQVFFPTAEISEASSVAVSGHLPSGSGRILLVDDEKYIAEMVKEMLEQLGYEVVARYGGAGALDAFRAQPERFDLVITDQTMPHMTGPDLAKEILKIRPEIPIVLCTGFSAMIDEARARKMGIKAFLMKPVALQLLAEEVHKLLKQK